MSEPTLVWRRYGLKDNPYTLRPITIGQENLPLSSFVGRTDEVNELISLLSLGSGSILVIGDSGVGKTSLVNFVRSKAIKGRFFSTRNEIELNYSMSGQEFIITTLSAICRELEFLKSDGREIILSEETISYLKKIQEISIEISKEQNKSIVAMDYNKLKDLFLKVMDELINPRFKGAIIHYDNIDNVENFELLSSMFGEIRDLLLAPKVIFIFVGNEFLPHYVSNRRRVRDVFRFPPLEVTQLKLNEIKDILQKRVEYLRCDDSIDVITPHTDEVLDTLFEIHTGNLRGMLNSLSTAVVGTAYSNEPIKIDNTILKEKLLQKLNKSYLSGLTAAEKEILKKILESKLSRFTPTDVSQITKKGLTNLSSKYLPKLRLKTAIELIGKEGRNVYYRLAPEVLWWNLEKIKEVKKQPIQGIDKSLKEFFTSP